MGDPPLCCQPPPVGKACSAGRERDELSRRKTRGRAGRKGGGGNVSLPRFA